MKGHIGYNRAPGDLAPPLGGPWNKDFELLMESHREAMVQGMRETAHMRPTNPVRRATENQWRVFLPLLEHWNRAKLRDTEAEHGGFEVALLSAVLTAGAYGFQPQAADTGRLPEEFRDDLRAASRVLSYYTGADEDEIFTVSDSQVDLMDYLGVVAMLPR